MFQTKNKDKLAAIRRGEVKRKRMAKKARLKGLVASKGRMASMGPAHTTAAPKTEPKRNRALLDMAEGRHCLFCVHRGIFICTPGSTVAAHSNLSIHGKAGARKADDCYSVWLGDDHHRWLDQGTASGEVKEAMFMLLHLLQVDEWRRIALDPGEPPRFQRAALWALNMLNATMTGDFE